MSSRVRRLELLCEKWREKTKGLRLELDKRKLRHGETVDSRDSWRQKAHTSAAKVVELEAELKLLRKKKT